MRKKNIYAQKINNMQQNPVKNKVESIENNSMNYLALSKVELDKIKCNLNIKLQKLIIRIKEASNHQAIKSDPVIKQLEEIQKQARQYDFFDLQKKIVFTLGQRILNLEIQNKRWQTEQKKIKKQQIEQSFFRHKKIKKYNYENLIHQKLQQNSYIARPYSSGKGFVESDINYRDLDDFHVDRLQQCWFLDVIKEVNKIYMNNYSSFTSQNNHQSKANRIGICIIQILCLALFIFGVLILSSTISNIQYFLMADVILIMLLLCLIGIKNYFQKPNHNNQLEQAKCDVKAYFQKINRINFQKGRKFTWICPQSFMYLQVHFSNP